MVAKKIYGHIVAMATALTGCVPASGDAVGSANITGSVSHQISGDSIELEGTISNTSPKAVCLGKPSISLHYPDPSRDPEDLLLAPFVDLGYSGPKNATKSLLVIPAHGGTSFIQFYKVLPENSPFDVVLGGDEADQRASEDLEKNLRKKGDYTVLMSVYKFECPSAVIKTAMLQHDTFMTDIAISPTDEKVGLDLYVGSIHVPPLKKRY